MEYRFSLTARMAALGMFAAMALLVLMFALGFMLGLRAAQSGPAPQGNAPGTPAPAPITAGT